jgi:hypothetical protein
VPGELEAGNVHAWFLHSPSAHAGPSDWLDERREFLPRVRPGPVVAVRGELPDGMVDLHVELSVVGVGGRLLCAQVPGGVGGVRGSLLSPRRQLEP